MDKIRREVEEKMPKAAAIELRDGEVIHCETGSYTILPSVTISRVEKIREKIGIRSIEQIASRFTDGVPIFKLNEARARATCHRQACRWSPSPTRLDNPPREVYGKGMTVEQSKASAMMEAVERYCGQKFPHNTTVIGSYEELCDYALEPSEFVFPSLAPKCDKCQERDRYCFKDLHRVCMEWSWGYALSEKKPVLIPSCLVYYPYISKENLSFVFNDTGGLSAGNTMEEAILQGIAEVVERDALYYAFSLGNLKDMPALDLKGSKSNYIEKFITKTLPPENIFAFRLTNKDMDIGVPTFSAFVCYRRGNERRYFGGSGTSLNAQAGLLRALTELEQQKVRQKAFLEYDRWNLASHNGAREDSIFVDDMVDQSTGNVKRDIELYLERLAERKTDVIVVNLTHPEIGIPVVRIVIPKLIAYSGSLVEESVFTHEMSR